MGEPEVNLRNSSDLLAQSILTFLSKHECKKQHRPNYQLDMDELRAGFVLWALSKFGNVLFNGTLMFQLSLKHTKLFETHSLKVKIGPLLMVLGTQQLPFEIQPINSESSS